jgi:hypothetical protein
MKSWVIVLFLAELSCPGPQPGPVAPAVDPTTDCPTACNILAGLGCKEATPITTCVTTLSQISRAGNIATPCGSALCPPMSCNAIMKVTTVQQAKLQGVCGN